MRIWDMVPPEKLCGPHLSGQWRESLGLFSILTQGKKGYANHPETKRWVGREPALCVILKRTRDAMLARGWNPKPLDVTQLTGVGAHLGFTPPPPWDDQLAVLMAKGCKCEVPRATSAAARAKTTMV